MNIKENLKKTGTRIARALAYTLSAVAGIAISWFYAAEFNILSNWYSLPIMAIFAGLTTAFIPWLGKKFYPAYAITSAGIALFAILMIPHFIPLNFLGSLSTFIIIAIVAILSDLILSKDRVYLIDIVLDALFSIIATIVISYLPSKLTVIIIMVTYFLVLTIQVKPELFAKKKTSTK